MWMSQDTKRREFAADLQSGEGRRHFFKIAKQMAKERVDVSGASCVKYEDGNIKTNSEGVQGERKVGMEVCSDTNETVESFCYLCDMLGAEERSDAEVQGAGPIFDIQGATHKDEGPGVDFTKT